MSGCEAEVVVQPKWLWSLSDNRNSVQGAKTGLHRATSNCHHGNKKAISIIGRAARVREGGRRGEGEGRIGYIRNPWGEGVEAAVSVRGGAFACSAALVLG